MSVRYLKMFGDLKLKNSITWIVQLYNLIWYQNYELKLKFILHNWISFLVAWIECVKKNWIEKGSMQFKNSITKSVKCEVGLIELHSKG